MYWKVKDATPITKTLIEDAEKILGKKFYFELQKIKQDVMSDYTFFGFSNWCKIMNRVLAEFRFFKKFYERRNKFRYQLRQKLKSKNEMKTELLACNYQKFIGYHLLRNNLQRKEKTELVPIDIGYEPTLDVSKPILCFFARQTYTAYQTFYEKALGNNKKKSVNSTAAKQCPYCNNFFFKSEEKIKKHISTCSGQAGFNFVFDNGKIVDYQENYKKIGDHPFSMFFDFETKTRSVVFFDAKMYVVSYCIIVAFHPELNLPRLVIYRSYDETINQLNSLVHLDIAKQDFFENEQIFNSKTL